MISFSYLTLSLNKLFEFTTLCSLYQPWAAKTTCREWKGGME